MSRHVALTWGSLLMPLLSRQRSIRPATCDLFNVKPVRWNAIWLSCRGWRPPGARAAAVEALGVPEVSAPARSLARAAGATLKTPGAAAGIDICGGDGMA